MKRMFKNSLKTLLCVCMTLMLTGCWDSLDVEKRDILTALIVDKKDGDYYYYTEIANFAQKNSQQSESQNKSGFSILVSKGKSFTEARDDADRKMVKALFLGAGRILIFTERMCDNGIEEYINRLRGQIDYRKSIPLATTSDDPMDILNNVPENSASVGFAIESDLSTLVDDGTSFDMNVGSVLQVLAVKQAGFLMPDVTILQDKITICGYTIFDKSLKQIGKITAENRNGVVYLLNPKSSFNYEIRSDGKKFNIKVTLSGKKVKPEYSNDRLKLLVTLNFDGDIYFADKVEPIDKKTVDQLKKSLENKIRKEIEDTIRSSQKYKCDYLDFYKYFRAAYIKDFEKLNWCEVYSNAQVVVETKMNIGQSNIPVKNN